MHILGAKVQTFPGEGPRTPRSLADFSCFFAGGQNFLRRTLLYAVKTQFFRRSPPSPAPRYSQSCRMMVKCSRYTTTQAQPCTFLNTCIGPSPCLATKQSLSFSLTQSHSLIHFLSHTISLPHSLSLSHNLTPSFTFSLTQSYPLIHFLSLTISLPHSLSLSHNLTPSFTFSLPLPEFVIITLHWKMKVLRTNSAQSSVIDTEESRHNQRKDQFVSLTRFFTTR